MIEDMIMAKGRKKCWVDIALQSNDFNRYLEMGMELMKENDESAWNVSFVPSRYVELERRLIINGTIGDYVESNGFWEGTENKVSFPPVKRKGRRTIHAHMHSGMIVPSNEDINEHDYGWAFLKKHHTRGSQVNCVVNKSKDWTYMLLFQRKRAPGHIERWRIFRRLDNGTLGSWERAKTKRLYKLMEKDSAEQFKDGDMGGHATLTARALERIGYRAGVVKYGSNQHEWLYGNGNGFV